jgi:hypothetical protein
MDKNQITKHRRSLGAAEDNRENTRPDYSHKVRADINEPYPKATFSSEGDRRKTDRKERSLSPYSRRLALTQAMNM